MPPKARYEATGTSTFKLIDDLDDDHLQIVMNELSQRESPCTNEEKQKLDVELNVIGGVKTRTNHAQLLETALGKYYERCAPKELKDILKMEEIEINGKKEERKLITIRDLSNVESIAADISLLIPCIKYTKNGVLPTLSTLTLQGVNDVYMKNLSTVLEDGALPSLTKLYLWENQIGDEGMEAFAVAVGRGALPSLKVLDLSNNQIGDAGIKKFAHAMSGIEALPSLTNLHLGICDITKESRQHLKDVCKQRGITVHIIYKV